MTRRRTGRQVAAVVALLAGIGCKQGAGQAEPAGATDAKSDGKKETAVTLDTVLANQNRVLLDVRTEGEWAAGHLPGAVHLPLNQIDRVDSVVPKDKPVVAYCLSGGRSGQAVEILRRKGYTVVNGGGFQGLATKMGVALER